MIAPDYIFGILGNITAILIFTSPIDCEEKICRKLQCYTLCNMLLSCSLWILYGIFDSHEGLIIITVNTAGLTLQALYITLFFIYSSPENRVKYFGFVILDVIFYGVIMAIAFVAFEEGSRRKFMGVVCATMTVMMYAAPLAAVRKTIMTKTIEYMPILLVFFLFINGGIWVTFAILVKDLYVLVPSALGVILAAIQLCVYLMYKNSTSLTKSVDMVKELEEGCVEMQMQAKPNRENSQKHVLTRLDAFPIIRSPSLSPERSDLQQLENVGVD